MLPSAYEAQKYEDEIYKKWESSGAFKAKPNPNKKPFAISMPPPNATGTLHLGHAVMLALEDILIRHRRMKGYEALWVPGTDHAAIATQNKVEKEIAKEGLTREKLGREVFLNRVREFVKDSQSTIRNQIRKMGSSCDWSRERYTFDDDLNRAVTEVFVRMYEDGLIYRGYRIVNWCPRCKSTLADDEVQYDERVEKLFWIKYGPFTVATARPETMLGDTAAAVHPSDKRYKKHINQTYPIPGPIGEFPIKVVADKAVDREFGSGVIKVTPAHSFEDFEIAQRHDLTLKKVIDEEGRMTKDCGKYAGLTTHEARAEVTKDLENLGLIEKIEDYKHSVGLCYRCNSVIEPLTSDQWFINVNQKFKLNDSIKLKWKKPEASLKELALHVVKKNLTEIIPDRFNKTYFHWMENLRDWCISRQIWWGHRIPVWYCASDSGTAECKRPIVSRKTPSECPHCKSKNLKQDADTLDTWFSSGLWTFSTLGWPEKTEDLEYFHPTSVLETGYDILFFWVARMILMSVYALNDVPFETVYLHGLIRDREGRKMSKSLGNGIDPLEMIEKFGADALRMSMVIGNTPGNDMRLYEEKIKGYRNFTNKLWNASRFVLTILEEKGIKTEPKIKSLSPSDEWILGKLNQTIKSVDADLIKFNISEAGQKLYSFLWDDFCDWYLELSKGEKQNPAVLYQVLKNILILLHPITPFVTEEIWSHLPGAEGMLIHQQFPKADKKTYETQSTDLLIQVITSIRKLRAENKIDPALKTAVTIYGNDKINALNQVQEDLIRLARISSLTLKEKGEKLSSAAADVVAGIDIYLPLEGLVDIGKEKERLTKEIEKISQFIKALSGKLSNENFVKNAPAAIVDQEKAKLTESEAKIIKLRAQLGSMK